MKIKEISPGVILLSFPTKKDLTFTMCRVEEFYEAASNKFRGQVFTWSEFLDEFMDDAGKIDYFHFWSGFNIPGHIYEEWSVKFKDLSKRELELIGAVDNIVGERDTKFYIIAAVEGEDSVEEHEIAHAKFYINNEYKKEMMKLNDNLYKSVRILMTDKFKELGYSTTVYEDELQAYLATSDTKYLMDRFKITEEAAKAVCPAYAEVFKKYG